LTLASGAAAGGHEQHAPGQPTSPSDDTARLLAGAALILGGLGVGLTLIRRRT
jgi:hypothetical protein